MAMSENMKRLRKESGLTQKALAGKTGLSFSMISKLESGEQLNPSLETIQKIASVLHVTPGELLNPPLSIEDRIDEYIQYKRGLTNEFPDLNFRKKLHGINAMAPPASIRDDDHLEHFAGSPEMKRLFSVLKTASKDELEQITGLIETFYFHLPRLK